MNWTECRGCGDGHQFDEAGRIRGAGVRGSSLQPTRTRKSSRLGARPGFRGTHRCRPRHILGRGMAVSVTRIPVPPARGGSSAIRMATTLVAPSARPSSYVQAESVPTGKEVHVEPSPDEASSGEGVVWLVLAV